jgi:hypothetical protein
VTSIILESWVNQTNVYVLAKRLQPIVFKSFQPDHHSMMLSLRRSFDPIKVLPLLNNYSYKNISFPLLHFFGRARTTVNFPHIKPKPRFSYAALLQHAPNNLCSCVTAQRSSNDRTRLLALHCGQKAPYHQHKDIVAIAAKVQSHAEGGLKGLDPRDRHPARTIFRVRGKDFKLLWLSCGEPKSDRLSGSIYFAICIL